jgi:cyclic pyranopterin phosphate synthase
MRSGAHDAIFTDRCGRRIDYLRLSVTDRCNLRCQYCLPEDGLQLDQRDELLSWEEMLRLCRLLTENGIRKIRLTGGEPFVRRGLLPFLSQLNELAAKPEIALTTNGVALAPHLEELKRLGISRLNISLDSLSPETYAVISRRDHFDQVWHALTLASDLGFTLKINVVVLPGLNDLELIDFAALTRDHDWTVRFIEPMPFGARAEAGQASTTAGATAAPVITGDEIHRRLAQTFPLQPLPQTQAAVDELYQVPGFRGRIGIIKGHSRTFCAACSRLRLSAQGQVRTCLYGPPVLDVRQMLRQGATDEQLVSAIRTAIHNRAVDGTVAAAVAAGECGCLASMAAIGG